jgi:CheY-like chemotaxis protein
MDIQMPVMDGLETASRIEKLHTGTPIIAMTANIMYGEMEIYKQSGIPDFISKPFTSQELWRCLLKYLKPVNKVEEKNKPQNTETDIDLEFKKVLQHHFWKNNQNKYNEMIKAMEAGDLELAHRIAHTLKGNAAQLGRTGLHIAAADVERQLKEGKATEDQLKTFEAEFYKFLEELSLIYKTGENA